MVCGKVPKFGSGINLSGELVPEFNYFKKFQVFKFLNLYERFPSECSVCFGSGGKKI